MRRYEGFDVWSTLVMKDGKWVHLPKKNDNIDSMVPPMLPSGSASRRMEAMNVFARERDEENRSGSSNPRNTTDDESNEELNNWEQGPGAGGEPIGGKAETVRPKPPKGFVSGVKRIDWPLHILRLDRKLEDERRAKEKAQARKERQIPKYKEIEHVSVKVNREAEIARRKLILNDREAELEKLKSRQLELEIIWQNLQKKQPIELNTGNGNVVSGNADAPKPMVSSSTAPFEENPYIDDPELSNLVASIYSEFQSQLDPHLDTLERESAL